jgi:hypothetical protein
VCGKLAGREKVKDKAAILFEIKVVNKNYALTCGFSEAE